MGFSLLDHFNISPWYSTANNNNIYTQNNIIMYLLDK